jgi:TonB family protein
MKSSLVSAMIHVVIVGLVVLITPRVGSTRQRPPERSPILIWNAPRTTGTSIPRKGWFGGPARHWDGPGPIRPYLGNLELPPVDPSDCCGRGPLVPPSDTSWDGRPSGDNGGRRTSGVLSADVVDVQVTPFASAPMPRYPEGLRAAGIEGEVVLEFVVDTMGRADLQSVRVISTPADAFVVSIRDALAATRYHPALVGGQRVRQLVRQGFVFSLTQH